MGAKAPKKGKHKMKQSDILIITLLVVSPLILAIVQLILN
jgi:Ni2+-binding GTPase involved in maturation of urease and hydrogenase